MKRRARRRLVGAIALVVFVVIALPIVLDSEPKPTAQDLTIQIPSQDAGKFATRVLPAQPDPVPAPTTPPTPAVTPPASAPEAVAKAAAPAANAVPEVHKAAAVPPVAPAVKPAPAGAPPAAPVSTAATPAAKTEAPAKDAPKAPAVEAKETVKPVAPSAAKVATPAASTTEAKSPAATDRGFIVPLGLYSKADNIKQVRAKAAAAGFKTYTEAIAGSGSVRVRAGPFTSRDAADKAREKLKGAGLDVGAVAAR